MRTIAIVLALVAALACPQAGVASVKFQTKVVTYRISGATGRALLDQMDRHGPKHGFLTRAIAQTRYSIDWAVDWREEAGTCRVFGASATLSIKYTFPEVTGDLPPELERRWKRFLPGVRKHELEHGRIARAMVAAAEKSVSALTRRNDRSCRKTRAEMKKRIDRIYASYEARQFAYDRAEHAPGGRVERLVTMLEEK
jgi:predicted secreted Zn-dependent protease